MSAPPHGAPTVGPDAPPWRLARFLRVTVAPLLMLLFRVRVTGLENLPTTGGYVLAGNHASYLDPILLWCACPRKTHFIARDDLFAKPVVGWVSTRVYAFPITRASADRVAIQRATNLLTLGEPIGMFPEGTRQPVGEGAAAEVGEGHSGVAFIAMRAGVPVIPVGISGTDKALGRGAKMVRFVPVHIHIGEPVSPDQFTEGGRKERTAQMTATIMSRVAQLREAAAKEAS